MNKDIIRARQIVRDIAKTKAAISAGRVKQYTLAQLLAEWNKPKRARYIKNIKTKQGEGTN